LDDYPTLLTFALKRNRKSDRRKALEQEKQVQSSRKEIDRKWAFLDALGLDFDPGLEDRLLEDVGDEPGNLPLLEFALKALWEARRGGRLLYDIYKDMGGVRGAIAKRAELVYARLDPAQQKAAEQVFTRLVRPGEDTGDTRRRANLDEAGRALVRTLAGKEACLPVTGCDALTQRETVEVAHEALIREWRRLADWVKRVRERLKNQLLMDDLAQQWDEQGRPRLSGLASGRRLKRLEYAGAASELAAEYLRASQARRTLNRALGGFGLLLLAAVLMGLAWLDQEGLTPRHPLATALSPIGFWAPIEPEMLPISADAGHSMRYSMGLESAEEPWMGPVHEVRFARPFLIGKNEVTFAKYERFALACWRKLPSDQGWGREDRPVINVSWEDARNYAAWLSAETGEAYRLPTEAEWEYAARGGTSTAYWWGDDLQQDGEIWANCFGCGSRWDLRETAPVGSFAANPFGLYDTSGNVWEWLQDCGHENYEGAPRDGSAWFEADGGDCGERVVRGGSWDNAPGFLRSANRSRYGADNRINVVGFRLAQSARAAVGRARADLSTDRPGVVRGCP
jgi:formylglycine-generating enzyme required for sulfatase activity